MAAAEAARASIRSCQLVGVGERVVGRAGTKIRSFHYQIEAG